MRRSVLLLLLMIVLATLASPATGSAVTPPAVQACNGLDKAATHVPASSPGFVHLPTCVAA